MSVPIPSHPSPLPPPPPPIWGAFDIFESVESVRVLSKSSSRQKPYGGSFTASQQNLPELPSCHMRPSPPPRVYGGSVEGVASLELTEEAHAWWTMEGNQKGVGRRYSTLVKFIGKFRYQQEHSSHVSVVRWMKWVCCLLVFSSCKVHDHSYWYRYISEMGGGESWLKMVFKGGLEGKGGWLFNYQVPSLSGFEQTYQFWTELVIIFGAVPWTFLPC